jgi:hypothetical protein
MVKRSEYLAHTIGLTIAIFGPLIKLLLDINFAMSPPVMYLYWALCLSIYIIALIPFTYQSPLTLFRLIILGITVEDFFSNLWHSSLSNNSFLPFFNWYTQYFPFLGSLGEPTSLILIPRWYIVALFLYSFFTIIQFRKYIRRAIRNFNPDVYS